MFHSSYLRMLIHFVKYIVNLCVCHGVSLYFFYIILPTWINIYIYISYLHTFANCIWLLITSFSMSRTSPDRWVRAVWQLAFLVDVGGMNPYTSVQVSSDRVAPHPSKRDIKVVSFSTSQTGDAGDMGEVALCLVLYRARRFHVSTAETLSFPILVTLLLHCV